jgi:hypothetical protein
MNPAQKRVVMFGGAALVIILISVGILASLNSGKVRVEVVVLPDDSSITLDGQPAKAGNMQLTKGEHTFTASRQDFTTINKKINTNDLDPDNPKIYLMPRPDSEAAVQWLLDHPEVQEKREAAGGAEAEAKQQLITERYPIVNTLPYETLDYVIGYDVDANNEISFAISIDPLSTPDQGEYYKEELRRYRDEALQYMRSQGVDTKTAKITVTPNPDE